MNCSIKIQFIYKRRVMLHQIINNDYVHVASRINATACPDKWKIRAKLYDRYILHSLLSFNAEKWNAGRRTYVITGKICLYPFRCALQLHFSRRFSTIVTISFFILFLLAAYNFYMEGAKTSAKISFHSRRFHARSSWSISKFSRWKMPCVVRQNKRVKFRKYGCASTAKNQLQ